MSEENKENTEPKPVALSFLEVQAKKAELEEKGVGTLLAGRATDKDK
jgi:hypothetical protein